jgi:hypothetical protein
MTRLDSKLVHFRASQPIARSHLHRHDINRPIPMMSIAPRFVAVRSWRNQRPQGSIFWGLRCAGLCFCLHRLTFICPICPTASRTVPGTVPTMPLFSCRASYARLSHRPTLFISGTMGQRVGVKGILGIIDTRHVFSRVVLLSPSGRRYGFRCLGSYCQPCATHTLA